MRTLAALMLLAAPAAAQQRVIFIHGGIVFDSEDKPLEGPHEISVSIWANSSLQAEEEPLWTETYTVPVFMGRYGITVGETTGGKKQLHLTVFPAANDRWMSLGVDGEELQPRLRFGVVPRAWTASVADDVNCAIPGCVEGADLAAGAVGADKIAAGVVTEEKLAAGAVTAGKIGAGAVTSDKLAPGAVTLDALGATGSGSGLDADEIDGLDSTDFARLQAGSPVAQTGDIAVSGAISGGELFGDGSGVTGVDAAKLGGKTLAEIQGEAADAANLTTGTLAGGRLAGEYGNALNLSNAGNTIAGTFAGAGLFTALRLPTPGSAPACSNAGDAYYGATDKRLYLCDGTAWKTVGATLGALYWDAASKDLGSGSGGATATATLRNAGDAALTGVSVVATTGFSVKTPCATSLAAGASCNVTFEMPAAGPEGARGGLGLATGLAPGGAVSASIGLTATYAPLPRVARRSRRPTRPRPTAPTPSIPTARAASPRSTSSAT
jgi:hypothetical protein